MDRGSDRPPGLDVGEREHLESVVTGMCDRVESAARRQVEARHLGVDPGVDASLADERAVLAEAIRRETDDADDWSDGVDRYVTAVGHAVVVRLAALRCAEVRGLLDGAVTVVRDDGLTPAADHLVADGGSRDDAVLRAYRSACDDLAADVGVPFDRHTDGHRPLDADTFRTLCGMLDRVPGRVWRADGVLGWVHEYCSHGRLDDLRRKAEDGGFDAGDVPPANRFYTPRWVVRTLTDNSLGRLYLEDAGEFRSAVETQGALTPEERRYRPRSLDGSPSVADLCTYLVPGEAGDPPVSTGAGDDPPEFGRPADLQVIDPACGGGHFLLYAFDVLERIWRAETDLDPAEIPRQILEHNLYGVDLDPRACQITVFSLYLKARTRAEREGADDFEMPPVGVACADPSVAHTEGVGAVFEEAADGDPAVAGALDRIREDFEEGEGLGSLLDVRGTLRDSLEEEGGNGDDHRSTPGNDDGEARTLPQVLQNLRTAIGEHCNVDSFGPRRFRSFVRLLDVLAREYHVALTNPPYGSRGRMPDGVREYVDSRFEHNPEYYVAFVEQCRRLSRPGGRVGALIPRSFMFKASFEGFRTDLVDREAFDFLAEFGLGVLDNATVRTVGTVLHADGEDGSAASGGNEGADPPGEESDPDTGATGTFFRLHDLEAGAKESVFSRLLSGESDEWGDRVYRVPLSELATVPGTPISYYTPPAVRDLHGTELKLDAGVAGIDGESVATIATGLQTGDNDRFLRHHWEVRDADRYRPYAKGGSDAWLAPTVQRVIDWRESGDVLRRAEWSVFRNEEYYGTPGLTWTYIKDTGRRFGYLPAGCRFDVAGSMVFPEETSPWALVATLNSDLYHALVLSLTPERQWNQGDVGRLPWHDRVETDELAHLGREQYWTALRGQYTDPTSPYYAGPVLLPAGERSFFYRHPFVEGETPRVEGETGSSSLRERLDAAATRERERVEELEARAREVDDRICDALGLDDEVLGTVRTEIGLRTGETPTERSNLHADAPCDLDRQVRELVHHLAMAAVREDEDGIVPFEGVDGQADAMDLIVEGFHDAYGDHAAARLAEAESALRGDAHDPRTGSESSYPNLRRFVREDLFEYHVDRMENAPVVWKLTARRLVADAESEGFACLVDYHRIDRDLFDRLRSRYLDPRQAALRERRGATGDSRDGGAVAGDDRTGEFETCTTALEQITRFEAALRDLDSPSDPGVRSLAADLAPKVAAFREETGKRLNAVEDLRAAKGGAWFEDVFSSGFRDRVEEERGEWVDALTELERACDAYATPGEPVEAHLADLFDYFTRELVGTSHYSSTGVLFPTYYFEREGADLVGEDGRPYESLADDEWKLASLASGLADPGVLDDPPAESGLAEYRRLAEEIDEACRELHDRVPSDWEERALSEVTTAGYRPVHGHGVRINIAPLAEARIVPGVVEDRVL